MSILNFFSGMGLGALLTTIIEKLLDYRLQKKKFQFEKLYIKRAKIIEETYIKLSEMHRAFESLMAPLQLAGEPSKEEKTKKAAKLANDFVVYFDNNRVYFDENLEQKLDEINKVFKGAWRKFHHATATGERLNLDLWTEAWIEVREEVPKIKEEIKGNFRKIIGI